MPDAVKPVETLRDQVRAHLRRQRLEGSGLVLAVSGGPDSVALVHVLDALHTGPLVLAHLNHGLRGVESDGDEAFVRDLGTALQLPVVVLHLNVAARAEQDGGNLEATGRAERYRWLAEVAEQHDLPFVATGHTADDQAETVLHRLLRGTGVQGLRGIAERRRLTDKVELVRPLLDVTRAEVLAFLAEAKASACQDSSNDDLKYTRNRLRHRLLPLLEQEFNPAIRAVLGRLAEEASEVFAEEQELATELLRRAELPRAGALLVFDLGVLRTTSRRRVRTLFRLVWEREGWDVSEMRRDHWNRVQALVFDEVPAIDFPGRVHGRRRGNVVQLHREDS